MLVLTSAEFASEISISPAGKTHLKKSFRLI